MTEEIKKETKNARWMYVNGIAQVRFPNGDMGEFDLSKLPATCDEPLKFYGFKQWVASNYAAFKTSADKITSATQDYDEAVIAGLELVTNETTVIRIIGKAKATKETVAVKVDKELADTARAMLQAMGGKITKALQPMFTGLVAKISNEETRKELLTSANISIS